LRDLGIKLKVKRREKPFKVFVAQAKVAFTRRAAAALRAAAWRHFSLLRFVSDATQNGLCFLGTAATPPLFAVLLQMKSMLPWTVVCAPAIAAPILLLFSILAMCIAVAIKSRLGANLPSFYRNREGEPSCELFHDMTVFAPDSVFPALYSNPSVLEPLSAVHCMCPFLSSVQAVFD
jgi:hypothetical protein